MRAFPKGLLPGRGARKLAILAGFALYALVRAPQMTEPAQADGDTRTLTFVNRHTNETGSFTFRRFGGYDQAELDKLNWFMRDWRLNEQTKMDPRLFDVVWEVYRESGSNQPIDVLSGYRSPQTNAMLRRRSRQVAEHSQHMQGKAIDAHFLDAGTAAVRDVAMRMQEGGVGFYPIGATPWVHIDSGSVRYWPRMSRASLTRLFPDGKTVFIPSDGQPMSGYDEAKAMIEARGEEVPTGSGGGGLFSWLFGGARGGGADDEEEGGASAGMIVGGRGGAVTMAAVSGRGGVAAAAPTAVAAVAPAPAPTLAPAAPAAAPEFTASVDSTAAVADTDAQPADADEPAAPLPPRRPSNLFSALDARSPQPPRRPADLDLAAAPTHGDADVIATLIERDDLPAAITKGVRKPPPSALALTEAKPSNPSAEFLARAAALSAPLPPPRPREANSDGVSTVERTAPVPPPRPTKSLRPSAANPFGGLVVDAFAPTALRASSETPRPTP